MGTGAADGDADATTVATGDGLTAAVDADGDAEADGEGEADGDAEGAGGGDLRARGDEERRDDEQAAEGTMDGAARGWVHVVLRDSGRVRS